MYHSKGSIFKYGMEGVWREFGKIYQLPGVYLVTFFAGTSEVYLATLTFRSIEVISHLDRVKRKKSIIISFIYPDRCILLISPQ